MTLNIFYLDASAFIKHYSGEPGADNVTALLHLARPGQIVTTIWILTESTAALKRKHNEGWFSSDEFARILQQLSIDFEQLHLLKTDTEDARESVPLILRHSLNATDALHLRMACKLRSFVAILGAQVVLVAADKRLLRAAKAEGLSVLNPEEATLARVQALFTP